MKTTVEIPDALYRQAQAWSARRGQSVNSFLLQALQEKLTTETRSSEPGWKSVFGKAPKNEVRKVQRMIDEEFSQINPSDWK